MIIFRYIKRRLYFFAASYFKFWAVLFLNRWKPQVITVIGSSGKTTLLHLFEAQLGAGARYSHKANSTFGIPFNILGLERKSYSVLEWGLFFVIAPFKVLRGIPVEKIYVTEADAERPGESPFLADLLKPEIVVWLSLEEAHGINYDPLVKDQTTSTADARNAVKNKIAQEFGNFLDHAKKFVVLNKDNHYITEQSGRAKTEVSFISEKEIQLFIVHTKYVGFNTVDGAFTLPNLVPRDAGMSVIAVAAVMKVLGKEIDTEFTHFTLPPSRSSVFMGVHDTTLIDSSYNATFDGMRSMLDLMTRYPASGDKWLVLGDMIEQGKSESLEHIELASMIQNVNAARIILVGPRLKEHTFPILQKKYKDKVISFMMPGEAYTYLEKEIKGGESILFKGARFLEGIVEKLLADPEDAAKLCRRETVWVKKRKQWGI
jgi:UDP-N-acetylmuramoyl-tripeptide--D-alanyl-D-alanine ligase